MVFLILVGRSNVSNVQGRNQVSVDCLKSCGVCFSYLPVAVIVVVGDR